MSVSQRIAVGAAASWFGRSVTILSGLVLLPVLFRHLPKEELGLWLLLGQTGAALSILDFGFGVTLTRRIAFAIGKSGGSGTAIPLSLETSAEIGDLVATGRKVYQVLAVATFAVSCSAGFLYLNGLEAHSSTLATAWMAWSVLCLAQSIAMWGSVWICLLLGIGYVGWESILASIVNAMAVVAQIAMVLAGHSIVALAIVAACGAIAQRTLILGFSRRRRPELFLTCGRPKREIFVSLLIPALRAWLTALGAAMVLYSDQIIIASKTGIIGIPAYRASFVLIHNITVIATTLGAASSVFISQLWQAGDVGRVRRIVEQNARFGWLVMLSGTAFLLVAGETLFNLWLGPSHFVGYGLVGALVITEVFEAQSYIVATASRATEDEAFAYSSLAGGLLKITLSWWFAARFGLAGVALGTTVALLLTNHWYMVYRGLRRLRLSFRRYSKSVLFPCLMAFPVMLGILACAGHFASKSSPLVHLFQLTLVTTILFALAVWSLVLEPGQRARLGRVLRLAT